MIGTRETDKRMKKGLTQIEGGRSKGGRGRLKVSGTFFDELWLIMNSYIVLRIAYRVKG